MALLGHPTCLDRAVQVLRMLCNDFPNLAYVQVLRILCNDFPNLAYVHLPRTVSHHDTTTSTLCSHHTGLPTALWLCQALWSLWLLVSSSVYLIPAYLPSHTTLLTSTAPSRIQSKSHPPGNLPQPPLPPIRAQWPLAPTASSVFFCLFCASYENTWLVTHFIYLCTTKQAHTHTHTHTPTAGHNTEQIFSKCWMSIWCSQSDCKLWTSSSNPNNSKPMIFLLQ